MNLVHSNLASRIWPETRSLLLRNIVLAVAGTIVVAVAAQINVPMIPVPMTLQTLAVLAVGMAYGARLGAATLVLYMLEGMAGLPVFAQMKSGLATVTGPSGGYIVGFIFAAGLLGLLAERGWDRGVFKAIAATVICGALIYLPGLLWLHSFAADWGQTLHWGLTPFIIGDPIKAVLAALLIRSAGMLVST
ncbi:MAG: biotin transporter BioY [Hyphomicrobiales bacterium]|nr:biotin transporter BioY [Hyphomicrobiales bacterium]